MFEKHANEDENYKARYQSYITKCYQIIIIKIISISYYRKKNILWLQLLKQTVLSVETLSVPACFPM